MTGQSGDDSKAAGASYVLTFFKEVQTLTHNFSYYCNVLIELEDKYKALGVEKVTDEEKRPVLQAAQLVRYSVQKSYIQYKSLLDVKKGGGKLSKDFENAYKHIKVTLIPRREMVESYVQGVNQFLVDSVIRSLLETSADFVKEVYSQNV